jgi:hypothetical protein
MKTEAKTTELAARRDQELGVAKSDRSVRKTISLQPVFVSEFKWVSGGRQN